MTRDGCTTVVAALRVEDGVVVFRPTNQDGRDVMQRILDEGEERLLWNYMGVRHNDAYLKDRIIGISYACGGTKSERWEDNVLRFDYDGAFKIYLDLSEVDDMEALWTMRCMGYFTGGMLLQSSSTSDEVWLAPKKSCKSCNGPLKKSVELEWEVCDTCSQACEHEYEMGVGQTGGRLAYLNFCGKCGRGDPDWQPSDNPLEDLLRTVSEGPLDALVLQHPDQSLTLITKK